MKKTRFVLKTKRLDVRGAVVRAESDMSRLTLS